MSSNIDEIKQDDSLENNLNSLGISPLEDESNFDEVNGNEVVEIELEAEESDDDEEEEPVTLGFVEKPENKWALLRHLFPSKAGGVPAWLDPDNLPLGKSCGCDICGEPLQFLLQVYASLSAKESTFHRMLYVFMCPSMKCLLQDQHEQWKRAPEKARRSVKVFRCQLPRSNPFYSSEPPKHDGRDGPSGDGATLCSWCGSWKGDKKCGSCKNSFYCSEKHQVHHWRSGHKIECRLATASFQSSDSSPNKSQTIQGEIPKAAINTLWPEYEIINEAECEFDTEDRETNGYSSSLVSEERMGESMKSLLDSFEGDADKKSWASFQERIGRAPEQVLRYCRHARAKPLWPMASGRPSSTDIPKCLNCGGLLGFEFQILPQLLYYFGVKNGVDSLDWASIVVYTCQSSCDGSMSYKEEFPWVQLLSQSASP